MASLIRCPHCGPRPREEFAVRGAALPRPAPEADQATWFDHVYLRDNPKGELAEYWHHLGGCRRWLIVTRNTVTHDVSAVVDAAAARAAEAEQRP